MQHFPIHIHLMFTYKNILAAWSYPIYIIKSFEGVQFQKIRNLAYIHIHLLSHFWMMLCFIFLMHLMALSKGIQELTWVISVWAGSVSVNEAKASGKRISSKVVAIILLSCVILTTLLFLTLAMCYIYWKDRGHIQMPKISSDKKTSCNSAINLISHRSSSFTDIRVDMGSSVNLVTGRLANIMV